MILIQQTKQVRLKKVFERQDLDTDT